MYFAKVIQIDYKYQDKPKELVNIEVIFRHAKSLLYVFLMYSDNYISWQICINQKQRPVINENKQSNKKKKNHY